MNADHLEQTLRDAAATLTLDRPVTEVLSRGSRLHRRRRRGVTLAVAGTLVAGALSAAVLLPTGGNPIVAPAVASFTGGATNLSSDELDRISDLCRHAFADEPPGANHSPEPWRIPQGTLPTVAEAHDGTTLSYFRLGRMNGTCTLETGSDHPTHVVGVISGPQEPLPTGHDVAIEMLVLHPVPVDLSTATPGPSSAGREGRIIDAAVVTRVSDAVAGVTLDVGGRPVPGHLDKGLGLFWLPDGLTNEEFDHLTITAYDAGGTLLERSALNAPESGEVPQPDPAPSK